MGFSFGSYATHGAIATSPDLADAVILTAIGFNETGLDTNGLVRSFVPRLANAQNPALYGDLDNGYVSWVDKYSLIWNYFKAPFYDTKAAEFVEAAKAPFSITEFLSFPIGPKDASNYTGPVLVCHHLPLFFSPPLVYFIEWLVLMLMLVHLGYYRNG